MHSAQKNNKLKSLKIYSLQTKVWKKWKNSQMPESLIDFPVSKKSFFPATSAFEPDLFFMISSQDSSVWDGFFLYLIFYLVMNTLSLVRIFTD